MSIRLAWDEKDAVKTGVCTVFLNVPEKLNALTEDLGEAFATALGTLAQSPDLKAIVLTGEGKAFSAGGDLGFLRDRAADAPHANSARMRLFYSRFLAVRSAPVPVLAAVQGSAIGAGLCLALACDMRVVATEARIGATFVGLGLHPGMGGTHTLARVAGPETAAYMLLTGATMSGAEAVARGLALEHLESARVLERTLEIARQIARQAPLAVRQTLRTLRAQQDEGLERALAREADSQALSYASRDLQEGIAALREKRAPVFTGT
jgi:enoyl-CoA hydratase/carnithine racemase